MSRYQIIKLYSYRISKAMNACPTGYPPMLCTAVQAAESVADLGGCTRRAPPRYPILSFWHTNFTKRSRLRSPRPPTGNPGSATENECVKQCMQHTSTAVHHPVGNPLAHIHPCFVWSKGCTEFLLNSSANNREEEFAICCYHSCRT